MASFIIIFVVSLIALIVLFLVVYKVYYNHQANKALQTGVPSKSLSPTVTFLVLGGFGLIVLNLIGLAQINDTEWGVMDLAQRIDYLHDDLFDLKSELETKIEAETINAYDVVFTYLSFEDDVTEYQLDFKVKEVDKDAVIKLVLEDEEGLIEEVDVISVGLGYQATLNLDIEKRYDVYLKMENTETIYQERITSFDPHQFLEARFAEQYFDFRYSKEEVMVRVMNHLYAFNGTVDNLGISSIELRITTEYDSTEDVIALDLVFDDFFDDELDETVYGYGIPTSELSDGAVTFAYIRITDEEGIVYAFVVEPEYTKTINRIE